MPRSPYRSSNRSYRSPSPVRYDRSHPSSSSRRLDDRKASRFDDGYSRDRERDRERDRDYRDRDRDYDRRRDRDRYRDDDRDRRRRDDRDDRRREERDRDSDRKKDSERRSPLPAIRVEPNVSSASPAPETEEEKKRKAKERLETWKRQRALKEGKSATPESKSPAPPPVTCEWNFGLCLLNVSLIEVL